jgi:acyl-CoA oxidase
VLGLGNEDQVKMLDEWQDAGLLGCFSLTEKLAGVNSGLVVNTQAHWDSATQTFNLHSPNLGAYKNWISQGLVADRTVAVADLFIKGKSFGPHAFVMNLRDAGKPVPGVQFEDMGKKTVGNDLDNAAIGFQNVQLPKSALLKYISTKCICDIYEKRNIEISNAYAIYVIHESQRPLTNAISL